MSDENKTKEVRTQAAGILATAVRLAQQANAGEDVQAGVQDLSMQIGAILESDSPHDVIGMIVTVAGPVIERLAREAGVDPVDRLQTFSVNSELHDD